MLTSAKEVIHNTSSLNKNSYIIRNMKVLHGRKYQYQQPKVPITAATTKQHSVNDVINYTTTTNIFTLVNETNTQLV